MAVEIKYSNPRKNKVTPKGVTILSLFDGMSCGRIALGRAGIPVENYYSSEVDKYAISVANRNYPEDTPNRLGDVREVDGTMFPKIDILIGGSPCQSFSFAGAGVGMSTQCSKEVLSLTQYLELKEEGFIFEGQSYLFWEYVRLLREIKPKYFLLENVKMTKKWEDVISNTLGVKPIKIDSSLVSAQRRPRLYWTNIPGVDQPKDKTLVLKDVLENVEGRPVKDTDRNLRHERRLDQKSLCTTATMYKGAGNNGMTLIRRKGETYLSCITPTEVERLQTVPDGYTEGVSNTQRYKMLGNGWTVDVIAHIFKGAK